MLIIVDLFNTDLEFKLAMFTLGAVGNEKGSYTSSREKIYCLFNEIGPGLSWISPEKNKNKNKKAFRDTIGHTMTLWDNK